MVLILAFSLQDQVEKFGAYVGLAAFLGLAVLSLLYFAQARELKRLRDWAGRAPERAIEVEARVVAQAEEALREAEPRRSRPSRWRPPPAATAVRPAPAPIPGPAPSRSPPPRRRRPRSSPRRRRGHGRGGPAEAPEAPGPEVLRSRRDRPAAPAVPVGGDHPEARATGQRSPRGAGGTRGTGRAGGAVAPAGDRPESAEPAVPAAGESAAAEDAEPEERRRARGRARPLRQRGRPSRPPSRRRRSRARRLARSRSRAPSPPHRCVRPPRLDDAAAAPHRHATPRSTGLRAPASTP